MMVLLDKYCLDKECILVCKVRERLLKRDCVIARFIRYAERQRVAIEDPTKIAIFNKPQD